MFIFGFCGCGSSSSSTNDVIRTSGRKEEKETPKKRDSLSSVMAKRSIASDEKRNSRFDSADFFLEQKGNIPSRKPPAKPSLEDIIGEKNNEDKTIAKTVTEHLKSTEYLEWAEPDEPEVRKKSKSPVRRGTLEALADLGVSFNSNDSFAGPKTSKAREEKQQSKSRWNIFSRKTK